MAITLRKLKYYTAAYYTAIGFSFFKLFCIFKRTRQPKAWFTYATDAPATWTPVLPGIVFRYENGGGTGGYVAETSSAYENQA